MAEDDQGGNASGQPPGGDGGDQQPAPAGPAEPGQNDVLSLSQLIGAPIHALVDAEAQSAMATARFIRTVGFDESRDGKPGDLGDLKMASFKTSRPDERGVDEEVEVTVPLLTLLPIPALQIQNAELEYLVKVLQTETLPVHRQEMVRDLLADPEDKKKISRDPPATMRATFAGEPRSANRRSMDMLLKMKVNIEQADMPAGLSRLLNLATETVNMRRLESGETTETTPEAEPPVDQTDVPDVPTSDEPTDDRPPLARRRRRRAVDADKSDD